MVRRGRRVVRQGECLSGGFLEYEYLNERCYGATFEYQLTCVSFVFTIMIDVDGVYIRSQ